MKPLSHILIQSDTNLFAINAIVVPVAHFYVWGTNESGKHLGLPVRVNPNVPAEKRIGGVRYRMLMPVLACHPISDTEFYTDVGVTDVNAKWFCLEHRKRSPTAYFGTLPDVAESDVRDKRYVAPLTVYRAELPVSAPPSYRSTPVYGATLHTDYLRTSILDTIDDATWEQLRNVQPKGYSWKDFLDAITSGNFTPDDDLSACLEDIDQEYMPEHIVKHLRQIMFDKRR